MLGYDQHYLCVLKMVPDETHRSLPLTRANHGLNGNSWEYRFLHDHEASILDPFGPNPPRHLRILATRLSRFALQLELIDRRFREASPTLDDLRVYNNLHSTYLNGINALARLKTTRRRLQRNITWHSL